MILAAIFLTLVLIAVLLLIASAIFDSDTLYFLGWAVVALTVALTLFWLVGVVWVMALS